MEIDSKHSINIYKCGFDTVSACRVNCNLPSNSKRGTIKTWSADSRKRLREFLLYNISVGTCYGITCTVPKLDFNQDIWLLLLKRFFMRVTRLNLPLVYRVELQTNGMPHLHCVSYFQDVNECFAVQESWWESLASIDFDDEKYGKISLIQRDGALLYSCLLSAPSSDFSRWYRYLCSHASKKKQAQLGYQGRHWGVCNKKKFMHNDIMHAYNFDDYQYIRFLRLIRKLQKCKTYRYHVGKSVAFANPETIRRICDFVVENTKLPF